MHSDNLFMRLLNERLHERKLSASKLAGRLGLHRSTVSRWANGDTRPDVEMLEPLAEALGLYGERRQALLLAYHGRQSLAMTTPPFAVGAAWQAPLRMDVYQNPLFVGREAAMAALVAMLHTPLATVALTGMGGIGKTQLAVEFAYRFRDHFPGGIFWLRCANSATFPAEVAACAESLELAISDDRDVLAQRVRQAWQQPSERLLIFDNCEDPALLARWRPTIGGCRVLITSRRAWWSPTLGVEAYPLGLFARHESVALLRRLIRPRAGDLPLDGDRLATIAAALGDLPLALSLAGHFLAQYRHSVTLPDYIAQLDNADRLFAHPSLQYRDEPFPEHQPNLEQAFARSYNQLDPVVPIDVLARALLARAACCAPGEPVSLALLGEALPTPVSTFDRESALLRLTDDLGLLERIDAQYVQMHRLIAAFTHQYANDLTAAQDMGRALLGRFTIPNSSELPGDPQWVRHLHAVADLRFTESDGQAADLCYAIGEYLWWGQDPTAVRYWERAAVLCAVVYGPDDLRTANALNGLGVSLHLIAAQARAAEVFAQVMAIRKKHLPAAQLDLLMCQGNLGFAQIVTGDYHQAEQTIREVQDSLRQQRGLRDHFTLRNIHNRGVLRLILGRYRDARRLLTLSWKLREAILTPAHPALAKSYTYLGETLARLGDLPAAQVFQAQALAIRTALYGEDSHVLAENLRMRGLLCVLGGDTAAGIADLERGLAITRQRLVPGHDEILLCLEALGVGLWHTGARRASQTLFVEALTAWEQSRGLNHVHTAVCHHMLGLLAWADGQVLQAAQGFERSLIVRTGMLSPRNPEQLRTRQALAALQSGGEPVIQFALWPTILPL